MTQRRAALAIGVGKTGGMLPLRAAVSGAREIAEWLRKEDFNVVCLDDEHQPVTIASVKDAVRRFVKDAVYSQLVIYFAGHGYLNNSSEIWLLSGAPDDPDEAIDQTMSVELARACGIPSVVLISDACRTNPSSLRGSRVSGSSIFPNREIGPNDAEVDVDRFFAARPGNPALEMALDDARAAYKGLFTEMLRSAHVDPDQSLVRSAMVDGKPTSIVPSRRLKAVLPDRVNDEAQARSIALNQRPMLQLECGDESFIGRASFSRLPPPSPRGPFVASLASRDGFVDGFGLFLPENREREASLDDPAYSADVRQALESDAGFVDARDLVSKADTTLHFETHTGVQVTGAEVVWAAAAGMGAQLLQANGSDPDLIRLHGDLDGSIPGQAASVILRFRDGGGTVLAALPGFIAAVAVEDGRVVNISYVPSDNSSLWQDYQRERSRVEALRATAAAAAREGLLSGDRKDVERFADRVRQLKWLDPTLGLYASLAYASVGLRSRIESVLGFMRGDIGVDLFDAVLLSGQLRGYPQVSGTLAEPLLGPTGTPIVPFCPMLAQGWSYLRPRGVDLPQDLAAAGMRRRPALWTTFEPEGMAILRDMLEWRTIA